MAKQKSGKLKTVKPQDGLDIKQTNVKNEAASNDAFKPYSLEKDVADWLTNKLTLSQKDTGTLKMIRNLMNVFILLPITFSFLTLVLSGTSLYVTINLFSR